MKKLFGLTRPVVLLGIVSLLTDLSSEMIYPILPLFLANVLGASTVFIGLIEGIAESTASLFKVFSGWLSDRLKKRKFLILAGYGISSLTKPFLALATSGTHVLGLRFLDRLGKGIRGAPRDAMIADATNVSERGKAFGFHRAMDTIGAIVGPAVTFVLLAAMNHNYRPLFLIATIPAFVAVGIIIFAIRDLPACHPREGLPYGGQGGDLPHLNAGDSRWSLPSVETGGGNDKSNRIPREFIILLIIIGIFTLGNSSDAFLILRAQDSGVRIEYIPLLWMFFNITYTLVSLPAGNLSDKIGRKTIILTGFSIYSLSYLGFALANKVWHTWALFGFYGLYYGMTEGVVRAYIADIVPSNMRATAFGIYNFVVGVLLLPANLLLGFVWRTWSPQIAFMVGAGFAVVATMSFAVLAPSKAR